MEDSRRFTTTLLRDTHTHKIKNEGGTKIKTPSSKTEKHSIPSQLPPLESKMKPPLFQRLHFSRPHVNRETRPRFAAPLALPSKGRPKWKPLEKAGEGGGGDDGQTTVELEAPCEGGRRAERERGARWTDAELDRNKNGLSWEARDGICGELYSLGELWSKSMVHS